MPQKFKLKSYTSAQRGCFVAHLSPQSRFRPSELECMRADRDFSLGTPASAAIGMKPTPIYLENGDIVQLRIENLGTLDNKMK